MLLNLEMGFEPREDPLEEVFLPQEPHGQRSLASESPWGCKVRHS